jgi:hypothetical protein
MQSYMADQEEPIRFRFLVIRQAQLHALTESLEERRAREFDESVLADLAENHPEAYAALGEPAVQDFVNRARKIALEHRFESAPAIEGLIDLMFEYGERFQYAPDGAWARDVLAHPSLPDHLKVTLISTRFAKRTGGRRLVRFAAKKSTRSRAAGASG